MKTKFFLLFCCLFKLYEEQKNNIIDLNYNYDDSMTECHFKNLTSSNFDEFVKNGERSRWLIMFYAENCGFCNQIKALINKIIDDKKLTNEIQFGKVDLTYNPRLQIRFNITKIPYVILVNDNKMYEMKFLPTEYTLIHFIESFNSDEYNEFKKDFPPDSSFFKFMINLIIFAFDDGAKKINLILKKYNILFEFTPITFFITSIIVGVPISILIYAFLFNVLCSKCKRNNNQKEKEENKKIIEKSKNE